MQLNQGPTNAIKAAYVRFCMSKIIQRPFYPSTPIQIKEYNYVNALFDALSRQALIDNHESSLDQYASQMIAFLEKHGGNIGSPELLRRLKQIRVQSEAINCALCGRGQCPLRSSELVGLVNCITEVIELFKFVSKQARKATLAYGGPTSLPTFRLHFTVAAPELRTGLFSEFGVSARTLVGNNHSSIYVTIKEDAFDREGLLQLLYVVAHEVLVHGVQGVVRELGDRTDADNKCSWSEGFMDRIVFLQVLDWLGSDDPELPTWLREFSRGGFRCLPSATCKLHSVFGSGTRAALVGKEAASCPSLR